MRNATRLLPATAVMLAVVAVSAGVALAGGWSQKVTGGGDAVAGGTPFSVTISASESGGQFQYSRDGLVFHGVVDCLYVADGLGHAVATGHITHASVPDGPFTDGAPISIALREGGVGSGDQVRVWPSGTCGPYSGPYPGVFVDGNVTIRTR